MDSDGLSYCDYSITTKFEKTNGFATDLVNTGWKQAFCEMGMTATTSNIYISGTLDRMTLDIPNANEMTIN